ncbi:MAG: YraN family protein [Proteobacteria bacterium]|nr:YraN family protein [Pseudomonadota bacterium]
MRDRKAATYLFGMEAEWLASVFLRLKGYRILAQRFSAAGGEIDLVAVRGGTLVFVEVKARRSLDAARTAITPQKLTRIERAARAYLSRLDHLPQTIRLDGLYLAPGCFPRHETAIAELRLM